MTSFISSEIMINTGIFVYDVEKGSPAEKAGIKKGDVILSVDDIIVDTLCELRSVLFSKNIGDKIRLKVFRDEEEINFIASVEALSM